MSERTPEGSIHTDSYIKNKKLMINGDYADNEIIVASIDGVEDKIIDRVIELNKEENELENRGNSIVPISPSTIDLSIGEK